MQFVSKYPTLCMTESPSCISMDARTWCAFFFMDDLCQRWPLALIRVLSVERTDGSIILSLTKSSPIVVTLFLISIRYRSKALYSNVLLFGILDSPHTFITFCYTINPFRKIFMKCSVGIKSKPYSYEWRKHLKITVGESTYGLPSRGLLLCGQRIKPTKNKILN